MKKIKFRCFVNHKKYSGYFLSSERPNNSQAIVERLIGQRVTNFVSFSTDIKITMVKCEEVE